MQAVVFVCSLFGLAAKDFVLVSSVEFDPKDLTYGKKLEGHCFQRIVKVSAKTCWERCNSHPKCVSFNYIRNFKLCELNSGTGTNANFSPTTGHYYGVVAKAVTIFYVYKKKRFANILKQRAKLLLNSFEYHKTLTATPVSSLNSIQKTKH